MTHHESPPCSPQEPPSVYCTPSPQSKATTPSPSPLSRVTIPSPFARIFLSRQSSVKPSPQTKLVLSRQHSFSTTSSQTLSREYPYEHITNKTSNRLLLRRHRHTNPAIWCSAIICLIFSVLLIIFGIATLIIYLVVKPKTPVFDITHANLSTIYFDTPGNFNGDFAFLANISNPNKKLNVKFEHGVMELLIQNDVIGTQSIQPFSLRHKETGTVVIDFVSSLVPLPQNLATELKRQVMSNKVFYSVRGTFKVQASFGALHFTYWLHGWCDLQMTSPPSGSLTYRTCKTKK